MVRVFLQRDVICQDCAMANHIHASSTPSRLFSDMNTVSVVSLVDATVKDETADARIHFHSCTIPVSITNHLV